MNNSLISEQPNIGRKDVERVDYGPHDYNTDRFLILAYIYILQISNH